MNKKAIALVLIFVLLIGTVTSVYLVQKRQIFKPKAGGPTPVIPQTSFTLSAPKSVGIGQELRVKVLVRSDIDSANLFAAKLKFPQDLVSVKEILISKEARLCKPRPGCLDTKPACKLPEPAEGWCPRPLELDQDHEVSVTDDSVIVGETRRDSEQIEVPFIKNWVENTFDNENGTVSLVGGVPDPGYQTKTGEPSALMATIVFTTKKAGTVLLSFTDDSAIYRNLDNLNILAQKRGTEVKVESFPESSPASKFETGLEAGAQSDSSRVNLVAESGAKWVRLNFIGNDWSTGSPDVKKYDAIINDYVKQNIKILGLIGAESVRYDRNNPAEFTERYVRTADDIIARFGDRVKTYEFFNEPNDWAGGSSAHVPARYFALYLGKIYRQIKLIEGKKDITIISGPLFSFDLATGADYLAQAYNEGKNLSDQSANWEKIKQESGNYPLDGIGYHIYVSQSTEDVPQVENKIRENLDAVKAVMKNEDPGKKFWISEFGWGTGEGRVTEEVQVTNLKKAFEIFQKDENIRMAMWFTLMDFDASEWGLVRGDGKKKLAWAALQEINGKLGGIFPPVVKIPGDINADGKIALTDMSILLSRFLKKDKDAGSADLNGDGIVNTIDYSLMISILIKNGVIKGVGDLPSALKIPAK